MPGSSGAESNSYESHSSEWFGEVEGVLEQGDVLVDFALPAMTFDEEHGLRIERRSQTAIVVTQSCDVAKNSQTDLLLASVFDFGVLRKTTGFFQSSKYRQSLSQGNVHSEFALPPRPNGNGEFLVVSFRNLHVVPKAYILANLPTESLRLSSPYKEYFAQAYARFMMRVGLPLPLPEIP